MRKNNGEAILQHYEKFLGEFIGVKTYAGNEKSFPIQLLIYENVFEGCKTYASLGVSKYSNIINNNCEVILVVDCDEENSSNILANALFYIINNNVELRRGTYIDGIKNINKEFYLRHNKSAIYFTETYYFPEEFSLADNKKMYLAFFISEEEVNYLKQYGFDKFEDYLEEKNCDIFELDRI